ncbi:Zinc finger protein [Musa troglodytarum]|uniref:Zinc finger protein n=1 Tax=Musa troglodytarum TaxID=320322 RepID=A0A9E7HLW6_9LILI|nr:Zinc finger protein [Musa troglodytarum]
MVSSGSGEPPPTSVVCCMCGDHGLLPELFQCKVCLVRSQHKYCSDLYLKTDSYRACNWCLRDEGETKDTKKPISSSNTTEGSGVKIQREITLPSQLNKPIKKMRLLDRSASDATDHMRSEELSPSFRRGGRQVAKGKVRSDCQLWAVVTTPFYRDDDDEEREGDNARPRQHMQEGEESGEGCGGRQTGDEITGGKSKVGCPCCRQLGIWNLPFGSLVGRPTKTRETQLTPT